jgi:hypothetical protein
MAMPKISFASTMIVEDHLKKMLSANSEKPFKAADNKLLPKMKHSPFGDFPADYMAATKKLTAVNSAQKIGGDTNLHELSIAAKGIRKLSFKLILNNSNRKEGRGSRWPHCQPSQAQGEACTTEAKSWCFQRTPHSCQ